MTTEGDLLVASRGGHFQGLFLTEELLLTEGQ